MLKGAKSGFLSVPQGENKVSGFDQVNSKIEIKPEISNNGILTFKIKNNVRGNLADINPEELFISTKDRKVFEGSIEQYITKQTYNLLTKLQELNSDPVGLGEQVRIKYPATWEKINWHEVFPAAKFDVATDFTIKRTGLLR